MTSTSDNIYSDANNTPPLATAVPLGLQHVLAMFASNVTPSIIVAGAAGLAFGGHVSTVSNATEELTGDTTAATAKTVDLD